MSTIDVVRLLKYKNIKITEKNINSMLWYYVNSVLQCTTGPKKTQIIYFILFTKHQ